MCTTNPRIVIMLENGQVQSVISDIDLDLEVITDVEDDIKREYLKDTSDGEFISLEGDKSHFVYAESPVKTVDKDIVNSYYLACQQAFK